MLINRSTAVILAALAFLGDFERRAGGLMEYKDTFLSIDRLSAASRPGKRLFTTCIGKKTDHDVT